MQRDISFKKNIILLWISPTHFIPNVYANWVLPRGELDWKTEWKTECKTELKNGMENETENAKVMSNPY